MRISFKRGVIVGSVVVIVPVIALAWWLLSPLLFDKTVEEEFPHAASAAVPEGMTRTEVEAVMAGMAKTDVPTLEAASDAMAQAVALKAGQFRYKDRFHRGSGTATLYRLEDGSALLRLEGFKVTNGPDLHVILAAHPAPSGRDEVHDGSYFDLGKLKGNIGSQNYPLPATANPSAFSSVVIYCNPFHVIFSVASLE
jgi:hypothetical protein